MPVLKFNIKIIYISYRLSKTMCRKTICAFVKKCKVIYVQKSNFLKKKYFI